MKKNIIFGLLAGVLLVVAPVYAQTYKWTDKNGTIHFTDDPNLLPDGHDAKLIHVEPVSTTSYRPFREYDDRSERSVRRNSSSAEEQKTESGAMAFDKFVHITTGMTEAEVLSRAGSPTRETADTVQAESYGNGAKASLIKKFYYIGDHKAGERTTIITLKDGIVINIDRIL